MNAWIHINNLPAWGEEWHISESNVVRGQDRPKSHQIFTIGVLDRQPEDIVVQEYENHDALDVKRLSPNHEYIPLYDHRRVRGYHYHPYQQGTDWAEAANEAMKSESQYNFMKR